MDEQRRASRARLFLAATLRAAGECKAVTVRNLSRTGALIEAQQPPAVGTEVELRRGALVASANIVWIDGESCGIRFITPIALERWLPGQLQVDEAIADLRAGTDRVAETAPAPALPQEAIRQRISDELEYVARMLDALGDELSNDGYVTSRFSTRLQDLDIAKQILGHLGTVLTAADPLSSIHSIGMAELRRRLLRKAL